MLNPNKWENIKAKYSTISYEGTEIYQKLYNSRHISVEKYLPESLTGKFLSVEAMQSQISSLATCKSTLFTFSSIPSKVLTKTLKLKFLWGYRTNVTQILIKIYVVPH